MQTWGEECKACLDWRWSRQQLEVLALRVARPVSHREFPVESAAHEWGDDELAEADGHRLRDLIDNSSDLIGARYG
jgi:hypothetical protein